MVRVFGKLILCISFSCICITPVRILNPTSIHVTYFWEAADVFGKYATFWADASWRKMRPFFYELHSCRLPPIISHSDCVLVEAQVILIRRQRFKISALKRALGLRPVRNMGYFRKMLRCYLQHNTSRTALQSTTIIAANRCLPKHRIT